MIRLDKDFQKGPAIAGPFLRYHYSLHCYRRSNCWRRSIVEEFYVSAFESEEIFLVGVELQCRESSGSSAQLFTYLVEMVEIDMYIAKSVNEFAYLQVTHMRNQMREECIRSNIERYTEENISRSLV